MKFKHYIFWGLLLLSSYASGADSRRIVPFILQWEGGFAKLPNDPGGETNKGVTLATWQHYYGKNQHDQFMKMPADKWGYIFKVGYWDKMLADSIRSQKVAEVLAEWCWLSGPSSPTKAAQRALGLNPDGKMGPGTLAAINRANEERLYRELISSRYKFIARIPYYAPSNWAFVDGWLNRLTAFVFFQADNSKP